MRHPVLRCLAAVALILSVSSAWSDTSVQELREEKKQGVLRRVIMENELVRLEIYPDFGARIAKAWYKPENVNVVCPDFDDEGFPKTFNGLIGGADTVPFEYEILENTADKVSIHFTGEGPMGDKTLTLYRGRSVLQVDWVLKHEGQDPLGDATFKVRNFPWPDGEPADNGNVSLVVPTAKAVRIHRPMNEAKQPRYEELTGKFKLSVGDCWLATTGHKHGITLANVFTTDALHSFYWWRYRSVANGTHEWYYRKVEPGEMKNERSYMALYTGLPYPVDVTRDYATGLARTVADTGVEFDVSLIALWAPLKDVRVRVSLVDFDGKLVAKVGEAALGDVALNEVKTSKLNWQGDHAPNLLIQGEVLAGGEVIGRYEDALKPAPIPETYTRKSDLPAPVIAKIPGWTKEEKRAVEITDADRAAGAKLYLDEFALSDDAWGESCQRIELNVVRDEWESFSVSFLPAGLEGNVEISVSPLKDPGGKTIPPQQVRLRIERRQDISDAKLGLNDLWARWIEDGSSFQAEKSKPKNAWFTINTHGVEPGDYTGRITFQYGGKSLGFDLAVKVWNVTYPSRPLIHLEVEHLLEHMPGTVIREGGSSSLNLPKIDEYIESFRRHRMTVLQNYAHKSFMLAKVQEDGRYDFSMYDPLLDRAIAAGMTRAMTMTYTPLPHKAAVARYLRSQGYPANALWVKNRDEVPPDQYPSMVEEARDITRAGWNAFSTLHHTLSNGKHTRFLTRQYKMLQGGMTNRDDYRDRLADGDIDWTTELWRYHGWGACWIDYPKRVLVGWQAVAMGFDGYHLHVYSRGMVQDALVLMTKDNPPVDSPAFEGARDGFEAATLYRLARYQIMKLKRAGGAQAAVARAEAALAPIIGDGKGILNRTRTKSGLYWWEDLTQPTMGEFREAQRATLEVLMDLKPHLGAIQPDLYWGRDKLVDEGKVLIELTGDANAVTRLCAAVQDEFGIDLSETAEKPAYRVHFALDPALAAGRYEIDTENPWRWVFRAPDEKGLERGVRNLVGLMSGWDIREIVTDELPRPEF